MAIIQYATQRRRKSGFDLSGLLARLSGFMESRYLWPLRSCSKSGHDLSPDVCLCCRRRDSRTRWLMGGGSQMIQFESSEAFCRCGAWPRGW